MTPVVRQTILYSPLDGFCDSRGLPYSPRHPRCTRPSLAGKFLHRMPQSLGAVEMTSGSEITRTRDVVAHLSLVPPTDDHPRLTEYDPPKPVFQRARNNNQGDSTESGLPSPELLEHSAS